MHRVALCTAVLTASLGLTSAAVQGAKPRSSELFLNVIVRDASGDGLRSDGGAYQHGQQNVRAVLVANEWGNFVFDTNSSASIDGTRRLTLDFQGLGPFPSPTLVDAFIGTIGVTGDAAQDGNLRALTVGGGSLARRMNLSWVAGNLQYSLRWNGINGALPATFICDAADLSGGCVRWIAEGSAAALYSIPAKGRSTETYHGTYAMPFAMTLDKQ